MDTAGFRKSDNVEDRRQRWYRGGASMSDAIAGRRRRAEEAELAAEDAARARREAKQAEPGRDLSPSQGNPEASLDDAIIGRRRAKRSLMEKDQDEIAMKVALEDLSDLTQGKKPRKRHERWYGVEAKETEPKGDDNG